MSKNSQRVKQTKPRYLNRVIDNSSVGEHNFHMGKIFVVYETALQVRWLIVCDTALVNQNLSALQNNNAFRFSYTSAENRNVVLFCNADKLYP